MDDIFITNLFYKFVSMGSVIVEFFGLSFRQLLQQIGFNLTIPSWSVFDLSLIELMFGTGLILFIGYTGVKWLIDLLP